MKCDRECRVITIAVDVHKDTEGAKVPVNTETKDPELKQASEASAPPQADKSISDTPKETETDEGQMVGEGARNKIRTKTKPQVD